MKINYIKLENFANVWTVYNAKTLEIDFTVAKNKTILFTGPNGSCKTTVLSSLHPFATNGNMDIRSNLSLIRKNKDGYKEIRINDDGNEYIIKHFYTAQKDKNHSVKSYISRNGMELNENGNVTSFKDIVKSELDIEPDYLKLTRLGGNVTNFIDLKTTERKAFMGKILEELDLYLKYYKKVSEDMRSLKVLISHLVDKIAKLDISDIDTIKDNQKDLKNRIDTKTNELSQYNSKLSIINYEIEKYDSPLIVKENLDIKRKEMEKITKLISKKSEEGISLESCESLLDDLNKKLVVSEANLVLLKDKRTSLLETIDKLIGEESEIKKEIDKIDSNSDVSDTEYMIKEIRNVIESRSKENQLINYEYKFTKKELEELIVMLDKNNDILITTYEFGKGPIKKAIEFILHDENINSYVSGHEQKVIKNKLQSMCAYVYEEITKTTGIPKPNCNCPNSCKVMEFFDTIYDYATEIPDTIIEDDTFVTYTKMAYKNITNILSDIKKYKHIFEKLPMNLQNMFTLKNFTDNIIEMKSMYDRELFYRELSKVTEYELQQDDLKKMQDLKDKLKLLKQSIGNSEYFTKRKDVIVNDIEEKRNDLLDIQEDISKVSDDITSYTSSISELTELKDSLHKKDAVENEYNELKDIFEKLHKLYSDKKEISSYADMISYELSKMEKDFQNTNYRIETYNSLSSQLSEYNDMYDEKELIRKSLSSKEGIPLLYIEVYLKNIQEITNELLDVVYDGELYLSDFEISADEFKIPFNIKGIDVDDVCYSSGGEQSLISVALSFALIYQSISRYNIMLLDEIDATLDTGKREKFLRILQKQMDMIDAEQIFLITHNNMFNMYPVDIINMKNKKDTDNKLANYIPVIIK